MTVTTTRNQAFFLILAAFLAGYGLLTVGCARQEKPLIVYAGKGLRVAMEEIADSFEKKHGPKVNLVFGGSQTLLTTLRNTEKGDVFIPGDLSYMNKAGNLVAHHQIIAEHLPVVAVRADNPKPIQTLDDLTNPGIRLAVGNKRTCAIGPVTEDIFIRTNDQESFTRNIIIESATANELLDLVIHREVDAAITFAHLLKLPKARDLKKIEIPARLRDTQKIALGVLNVSENRKTAELFADFAATEGQAIFKKHGFGE